MGFVSDIVAKGYGGYAGWSDAAAQADFNATGGAGKKTGGATSSGGSGPYATAYNQTQSAMMTEYNKYIDELISQTNGDYNFAAKWLEQQYKLALGSDDTQTASFLKTVANGLEQKVGRIEYDYNTSSYRNNQDKMQALDRLAQDEQTLKTTTNYARQSQNEDLNQRGLVSSTRDAANGLAGYNIGNLEADIRNKFQALDRQRNDINTTADRTQQDLATEARRSVQDQSLQKSYEADRLARTKEKSLADIQREKYTAMKTTIPNYSNYITQGKYFG